MAGGQFQHVLYHPGQLNLFERSIKVLGDEIGHILFQFNGIGFVVEHFLLENTKARRVELLPFHRLGLAKYEGLGMSYAMAEVDNMSKADCSSFAEIGRQLGLAVQVGAG